MKKIIIMLLVICMICSMSIASVCAQSKSSTFAVGGKRVSYNINASHGSYPNFAPYLSVKMSMPSGYNFTSGSITAIAYKQTGEEYGRNRYTGSAKNTISGSKTFTKKPSMQVSKTDFTAKYSGSSKSTGYITVSFS